MRSTDWDGFGAMLSVGAAGDGTSVHGALVATASSPACRVSVGRAAALWGPPGPFGEHSQPFRPLCFPQRKPQVPSKGPLPFKGF